VFLCFGMSNTLYIKNMVCPRCITSVGKIFKDLDLRVISIHLGEIIVEDDISDQIKDALGEKLLAKGFELLKDHSSQTIDRIKSTIIDSIHYSQNQLHVNLSTLLSEQLNQDYSSISRLFSMVEGKTIERYVLIQKIEKVKELLFYNELTLSEIASQLNYSSVAYLSSQFKKETGMTATEFKNQRTPKRNTLDSL
jgi:AraC-like DNA-binding protein